MYQNTQNAHSAYGSIQKETMTPRSTEYRVFLQVTARLEAAHQSNNKKSVEYVTALGDNQLLWNALAADVASSGNGLPEALKGQIFYLAQYMSKHTTDIRTGDKDLQPIIDINKMIIEGLSTQVSTLNDQDTSQINTHIASMTG
ncbi:MAG: flagellar protein FlaF [Alphaproteobacteria bacterium]|jgi:flagellar protein FlaF